MLPEQAPDTLEYSWVVINDQNEVLILQADILTALQQLPAAKTKAPDPFREPYAISEGLPGVRRSTRSTGEPVPPETESAPSAVRSIAPEMFAPAVGFLPDLRFSYSIANALETIATGLLSVAERSVTRPKLMVRPRRTTRASASTSEAETARMKCVVWSTVVIGR